MAEGDITKDMIIGTVIEEHPETEKVFRKYFGKGCFDCPGSKNEDIAFGSMMHNVEADAVLRELNEAAKEDGKRREMREKITKEMVVNDCIRLYPKTIGVFTRFNIDSCCGGAVSIEDAARRDGAPLAALMKDLNGAP